MSLSVESVDYFKAKGIDISAVIKKSVILELPQVEKLQAALIIDGNAPAEIRDLLKDKNSQQAFEALNLLKESDILNPPPPPGSVPISKVVAPPGVATDPVLDPLATDPVLDPLATEVPPVRDNAPPVPSAVDEQENPTAAGQGGWKSYGALVLGALGILAWIGSLFSSEEGSKGKAVFAGIGGLLLGGALLSQWPSIGKLFGSALEAVKGVVQPDNGAATETH